MDKLSEIYQEVGKQLGMSVSDVRNCYRAIWKIMHDNITAMNLAHTDEILTEEEFNKLNLNFNISSIGKLHLTYDDYVRQKEKFRKNVKDKESTST